jgi:hypothetical protein
VQSGDPLEACDGRLAQVCPTALKVGSGVPGPFYRRLLAAWSEEVGVEIAGQARDYAALRETWKP